MDQEGPTPFFGAEVITAAAWMMQLGERCALEGLLSQLRPRLAIEVGTWEGGSLRRIAAHATEVHAFDIDPRAQAHADALENVTLHLGNSAETVPAVLADFAASGREVDFALVDGLHTYDAVSVDASSLLDADACRQTTIIFHDAAHAEVRRALEDLRLPEHPKVAMSLLDFVPGYLVRDAPLLPDEIRGRSFNGLGLVVLDSGRHGTPSSLADFVPTPELYAAFGQPVASPRRRWRRVAP